MGAWGTGHFENDTACDWAYELEGSNDLGVIERTIDAVFEDTYVDADVGSEALAAIEAIARLRGNWGERDSYTESMDKWVEAHRSLQIPPLLLEKSKSALERIMGPNSELEELWAESDLHSEWRNTVSELGERFAA